MHVYDQQVKDDTFKANDATCTEAKKYYYSCICGAKGTEVFTDGDPLGHTWESWQRDGADQHTRTCSVCSVSESEACSGGTATCIDQAVCPKCHKAYGVLDPNNHTGIVTWIQTANTHQSVYNCCHAVVVAEEMHEWENDVCLECGYPCLHTGGTATCSQRAVCEICGSQYGDLDPNHHQAASAWTQENDKHYHKCIYGCDTHLDEADCSGGTASCLQKAACTVCSNTYGTLAAHRLSHREEKAATCTEAGNTAYWHCSVCMKKFVDQYGSQETTYVILPVLEHTYGEWMVTKAPTSKETGSKTKSCTVCGHTITEVIPATNNPTNPPGQSGGEVSDPSGLDSSGTNSASKATSNHIQNPQTNDSNLLSHWFILILLSGIVLSGTVIIYNRRDKN